MLEYPNASYCMFQNTLLAVEQLMYNLTENKINLKEMSKEEQNAYHHLFYSMEALSDIMEDSWEETWEN